MGLVDGCTEGRENRGEDGYTIWVEGNGRRARMSGWMLVCWVEGNVEL